MQSAFNVGIKRMIELIKIQLFVRPKKKGDIRRSSGSWNSALQYEF